MHLSIYNFALNQPTESGAASFSFPGAGSGTAAKLCGSASLIRKHFFAENSFYRQKHCI
jgi:hypothetical protein